MLFPVEKHPLDAASVVARYRRLRTMQADMSSAAMKHVAPSAFMDEARALGLAERRTLIVDDEDDLAFIWDLALHAPRRGRSRAIDRYRTAARYPPGSEEALFLDAICAAAFSIWRVERRHEVAGLVVLDTMRGGETWLMDEGMSSTVPDGFALAMRLAYPGPFAMTLGVGVPVDREILEDALDALPAGPEQTLADLAGDARFALATYRAAFAHGAMERIRFAAPGAEALGRGATSGTIPF